MNARSPRAFDSAERSIGAILIDAGRINIDGAERILRAQRELGLRFGDAAVRLGLATQADVEFALSQQFDYPYLQRGNSKVSESVVAAYQPFSPQVEALRALRSQLVLRWFDTKGERKALAVVSSESGEGRSWFAANLAVVFSQLGERTLLIDADLRKPAQHALFGLESPLGLSSILSGRSGPEAVQRVPSLVDLSVLAAGPTPPNPQELLARPILAQLLRQFAGSFDVVLIDTPPGARYADGQTLAVRAGGALLVSRQNKSRLTLVRAYADRLQQAGATVVGTVLNRY